MVYALAHKYEGLQRPHFDQKSKTLWPGGSGTLGRYVLVAALNRACQLRRRLAAVFACCPVPAAHRRSVWITGPSGGWVPGEPLAMRPMPAVQARLIVGACSSSEWTVASV